MIYNYTQYYDYFRYKEFELEHNTYINSNDLIAYKGIDGIKASHLNDESFWNIIVSYIVNGRRIIIVNLGYKNQIERTNTTKKIVDEVVNKIPLIEHGKTGSEVINSISTKNYYTPSSTTPKAVIKGNNKTEIPNNTIEKVTIKDTNAKNNFVDTTQNHYKIQLGAYKYKANANNKVEYIKIKYRYIEEDMVFIQNMKIENQQYYKPTISNLSKEQANKICNYLKDNKDECFVAKY